MTTAEAPRTAIADARPAPHFHVGAARPFDLDAATTAVTDLLVALGLDVTSEELCDTPRRTATAFVDLLTPRPFTMTTFPNEEVYDERLTRQVADAIDSSLAPRGVGVVLEATHSCMSLRGVRAPDAKKFTTATLGAFRDDPATRAEFSARTLSPMR